MPPSQVATVGFRPKMSIVEARVPKGRVWHGAIVVAGLALATTAVALLEHVVGIPNASSAYLVAVVISAMTAGTAAALATAVAAILTYDVLFTEPFLTPVITDTSEWLSLVLFSFVGISVGHLVALQRRRTREALTREREARDLYAITRVLAARTSTAAALTEIAHVLCQRTGVERIWFTLGTDQAAERTVADSGVGAVPDGGSVALLRRGRGEAPDDWIMVHAPGGRRTGVKPGVVRLRVPIEVGEARLGSLWGIRDRAAKPLDATASRLLAAAADQVGQVLRQDRLAAEASEARIARETSALKSALVESVSHDLRTPLASIRATAGTLSDPDLELGPDERVLAASSIDREAERLDRIVTNLLDLGRIQGGALQARREAVELGELVERAVARLMDGDAGPGEDRRVDIEVGETWVDADPVLLEQAILNVLDNALRHTPRDARVRVATTEVADGSAVRLSIEDSGPGVPVDAMPRLFERRDRLRPPLSPERLDSGLGLTIVRGFVEAMGGRVSAGRSQLGGLAIELELVPTRMPAELVARP